jgi:hypothetical protein
MHTCLVSQARIEKGFTTQLKMITIASTTGQWWEIQLAWIIKKSLRGSCLKGFENVLDSVKL